MTPRERETIRELSAYQPVEKEGLNLSDNANLFDPNPAIQRGLDRLDPDEARGYPSGYGDELREAIGQVHDHTPEGVVTANGSSDLIDLVVRAFTDPDTNVAYHPPSFSMIDIWTHANAANPHPIPLDEDFALDEHAFADADTRVGFICRPNNPTGNAFTLDQVETVADRFDGLLVVDEAYVHFLDGPTAEHLATRDDVIVLRSLSKDQGLAGIRFGYAFTTPAIAESLHKVRGPFRVPRTTEAIALEAIENPEHREQVTRTVQKQRERVRRRLDELGYDPHPTKTNFVLFETPWDADTAQAKFEEQGVLVRAFSTDRLAGCVRATIGPPEVNDRFLDAAETLAEGAP